MLIYSKIDGFHKFAKYTLCPPKSNPDYGSAYGAYCTRNCIVSVLLHEQKVHTLSTKHKTTQS